MLELGGMQSTPSFLSLPGPLWPGVVVSDMVLFICQIELNCVLNCARPTCLKKTSYMYRYGFGIK